MDSCRESEQPVETGAIVQMQPSFEEHLSTLRLELEGSLQEVRWWMKDVQCKMTSLQDSQSSQGAVLQDVHSLLRSIFQPSFPRKEEAPAESFVPLEDPPLLCFPSQPGQVCPDEVVPVPINGASRDSSGRESTESTGRKVKDSKYRRKNPPKAKAAKGRASHASTLDELEAQTAKNLLVRKQSSHTLQSIREAREVSLDESDHLEDDEYTHTPSAISKSRTNSKSKRVAANKTSGSDKNAILGKCQRMSLDELRENHDAAMCVNQSYSNKTAQERESTQVSRTSSPMPPVAKLWLQLLCILPLQYRWLGHFWTLCVFLILLAPTTLLAWLLVAEKVDTIMTSTVLCYLVGVIAATWSLRRANIQELLGSSEGSMEQYAFVCGFSQDWRKVSRRRFEEVLAFLVLILGCRWLVHLSEGLQHGFEPSLTFSIMAVGFAAVAYAQLHIVAGLELAIDSFSINFFRDMDCGRALEEWNVLQATLRQISTKLSGSMLVLGISCGASMLFLVEIAFLQSDENRFSPEDLNGGFPLLLFTAWVFPPVLLFLYVLMPAAGVTEKASRVAPLVNSWNLEDADVADDSDDADVDDADASSSSSSPDWMDLGRQYIVQYIKQSETGFYMHGVRLHGFQVTKLGYYFGAFVFAIMSKIG